MRFRTRDLMIQALPEQSDVQLGFGGCGGTCFGGTCFGGTCGGGTCGGGTCGPRSYVAFPIDTLDQIVLPEDPVELGTLKAQLQKLQAEVERREQILIERDRPQTIEEIDAMEEKLKAALEELSARRNELGG